MVIYQFLSIYVNFDAATLAMDDIGEKDRVGSVLWGNARVLTLTLFTQSLSKCTARKDMAMGELISKHLSSVFCAPFVKNVNSSAFPPLFKDGYSWQSSVQSGKYNYPESPTYPLINYTGDEHIGRLGSFTVPPFRAVDEIPRWVPLWFPSGGKSHAYNLLGGKQSKLSFELPKENSELIAKISAEIEKLETEKGDLQVDLAVIAKEMSTLSVTKAKLSEALRN